MAKKKRKRAESKVGEAKAGNLEHLVQMLSAVGSGKKPLEDTDLGRTVVKTVGDLRAIAHWAQTIAANCTAMANGLGHPFGLPAEPLSAEQSSKYYTAPQASKGPTPYGEAQVPPKGEPPPPKDGENYTAEELANPGVFSRAVLAKVVDSLDGKSKGKMAPALRAEILRMQSEGEKVIGECEVTEDEDVELTAVTHEGIEYQVGPRVVKAVEKGLTDWDDVFEGEYEFD